MNEEKPDLGHLVTWTLPIRTVSEANNSDHWSKKAKRRKQQQILIRILMKKDIEKVQLPCHITLTRLSPRMLDTMENLPMAFKAIIDEIADILIPEKGGWYKTSKGRLKRKRGHSDGDKRLTWAFGQEKSRTQGIRVSVSF